MRLLCLRACRMIARLARFIESWPGVAAMWLALAAYCYL